MRTSGIARRRGLVIWLKRATGIGYRQYPPLVGTEIEPDAGDKMLLKTDAMIESVEHLEQELRRLGIRTS